MIRTIVGFSVFAFVGVLAMKFILSLLGGIFSVIMTVLVWAFWGWVFYVILKLFFPDAARRLKETITGRPAV
jgi:hypothetical protein